MPVGNPAEARVARQIALGNIPAFPAVVLRVLDLVSQDDPATGVLVQEIASDATLSAQVLRLANSAQFGFVGQIRTVGHAVVALGLSRIQALVTSVATANYSRAALRTRALHRVWRHTLASAVISRELARAAGAPAEHAYTLGLLHDMGRLGLLVTWPDDYDHILREADRDNTGLLDLETRLFGMDHCEVGRRLAEQWKLPQEFCLVAGRHHDPSAGNKDLDSLAIASLSCRLADALGYWVSKPFHEITVAEILAELPGEARARLPRDEVVLQELVEKSVSGGSDLLNQSPSEYHEPRRRETPPARLRPDSANPLPAPGEADSLFQYEEKSIGWDFTVVLITVAVFAAVMVILYLFNP